MNERIAELKKRANQYSLADLKKAVKGKEPFGRGMEGRVYHLDDDLVIKLRNGRGAGYNQFQDNLAEHQRQAIHDTINTLANNKITWDIFNSFSRRKETLTSRLIDILRPFVDGQKSASIMAYYPNRTLNYDAKVKGIFDAYKKHGVTGDFHGDNVMFGSRIDEVDYLVLETCGDLHPDIFKSIERIKPENKDKVLEHLAKAHLFGGTSSYPTPNEEMAGMSFGVYCPIDWHDIALVSKANRHKPITYQNLKESLSIARKKLSPQEIKEVSKCGLSCYEWEVMGIPGLVEAKGLFGEQFIPMKFDWDEGSNLEVYGINPTLFNEFRLTVDKIKPEIEPIIASAKKKMKRE